jgi:hypothetical protein
MKKKTYSTLPAIGLKAARAPKRVASRRETLARRMKRGLTGAYGAKAGNST